MPPRKEGLELYLLHLKPSEAGVCGTPGEFKKPAGKWYTYLVPDLGFQHLEWAVRAAWGACRDWSAFVRFLG